MKMNKILVTESNARAKALFAQLEKEGHKVFHIEGIPGEDEILAHKEIDILSVFVNTRVTKKVIEGLPDLKLIVTRSTGVDHIDTVTAIRHNVAIANVAGYGTAPVAEQTFGLLLSLVRKIIKADASVRAGLWEPFKFQGANISGKTFGVIGTGAIGINVCRIAKAFGANVIAYDIIKREDMAREVGFSYVDLKDLIRKSDIISLHIPLSKETHRLINAKTISKMKDGVIIVNTARGSIIDYKALTEAIKSGKVAGAGLDVYEQEPPEPKSELCRLENTVLTPHIAWNTVEAENYILDVTINTIREFIAGRKPKNIIS
jgi:phosphoglycerate dehydrogenase-like enzyme